ncbi:MAG TPA: SRPBCC family protein [Acidimicrobiales bacterium]|jgi:uncharacterized protein YndB with AHSA1/START domain
MGSFVKEVTINRPIDEVWDLVGDIGAISSWFPGIDSSTAAPDGSSRVCMMGDAKIVEEIVSYDADDFRYQYTITAGPLPLDHHLATVSVEGSGGGSLVRWEVEIVPDSGVDMLSPIFDHALGELKDHLESS